MRTATVVALALLALVAFASAAHATPVYWGPVKVHIGSTVNDPTPLYWQQILYPSSDQLLLRGACPATLNPTGNIPTSLGPIGNFPGRVELPGQVVYDAYINSYTGPLRFQPSSSLVCYTLLFPGQPSGQQGSCMIVDGHVTAAPDLFGWTWVVDDITPCSN